MKEINNKLKSIVKLLKTLNDEDLEKALINRSILDRVYLMKKDKGTDLTHLIENFTFNDLVILETYIFKSN
jgi:hypothetical protein